MTYSIGEISNKTKLTKSTLRYYDKLGLFNNIKRTNGNIREFDENSLEVINLIECLKMSGLNLNEIKEYIELVELGDSTLKQRKDLFDRQLLVVEEEMVELEKTKAMLLYKRWIYEESIKKGNSFDYKNLKFEQYPNDIKELLNKGLLPTIARKLGI